VGTWDFQHSAHDFRGAYGGGEGGTLSILVGFENDTVVVVGYGAFQKKMAF
jgi:hypothetical protein